MNVPLSVGPQYKDTDNKGVDCFVYDIIVNPKVLEDAKGDETGQYRDFLCHLAIQSVEQKYPKHGNLDRQYKLPKLKYMGAHVQSQYIRDRKSIPKIEEVSAKGSIPSSGTSKPVQKNSNPFVDSKIFVQLEKDLPYKLVWIKYEKLYENLVDQNDISIDCHEINSTIDEYSVVCNGKSNCSDYAEPILIPDKDIKGLSLIIDFLGFIDPKDIDVKVSPFKFQVCSPLSFFCPQVFYKKMSIQK